MKNIEEIMQLCRLCLVKDQVNILIFDEQDNTRQILTKISTYLPVKVSQEDNLPKKICDECSHTLDTIHQFWNKSADSEKKLLQWLNQEVLDKLPTFNDDASLQQPHFINTEELDLKEENVEAEIVDDLNASLNCLPQSIEVQDCEIGEGEVQEVSPGAAITNKRTLKRKRSDESISKENEADDIEMPQPKVLKTEEQSGADGNKTPLPITFVEVPMINEQQQQQPGPSTSQKATGLPLFQQGGNRLRKIYIPSSPISSSQRNCYERMYQKYRKRYRLKPSVVLLGDLSNLDTKVFRPSRKMRILLYHLNRHRDDNGKRRYRRDDTVKTAFEKALEIADDDSDDEDVFPVSSKRSQIQRLFDSDDDVNDVNDVENNIILIEPPKHKDQDSNEKRLEVESHMKRLFDPEHYNSDTVRKALPESKDCDTNTNSNKQDGSEKSLGIVDANSDHNSKKSQARSIFDSDDDNDDNTAKDKTSKIVLNSKEDEQDLSATYVMINSSEKPLTNNKKSQAKRPFDSENNSNEPPHKKSKDQVKNSKKRLEKSNSKEKPNGSKNETSNLTNESGKIIHIFGASFLQQYKCDQCYQTFDDCFKLKRHSMVAHKTKPSEAAPKLDHACHICSKKFSDRNMLWGHMRVHSLRDKYSCKLCKFEASSVRELIDHQSVCKGKKQTSNKAEEKTNNLEKESTKDVIVLETNNEKADSNNEKKTSNITSNKIDIAEKSAITKEKSVTKTNKSQSLSNVVKKRINSDNRISNKDKDRKTSSNNIDDAIQKPNDIEEISDNSKKNTNNTQVLNDAEKDNAEISTGNTNLTTSNTADKIEKQTSTALKYRCSICKKKFAEINEMRTHKTLHCSQQTPFEKKSTGLGRTTLLVDMIVTTDNSNRINVTSVTIAIANNTSDVTTVTSSNLSRVTCCSSSPDKIKSSPTKPSDDLKLIEMKPKFKCCGKIFAKRIDLFLHMKEESGTSSEVIDCDPVYICDICLETFYERLAWYQHSKIKHKNYYEQRISKSSVVMRKPRYACGTCYMKFDLLIKLKEHKSACSNLELNKKRAELNISDLKNQFEEFYQSRTVTEIDQNQNNGERSDDSSIIIDPDSDTDNIVETNVETDSHDPDINVEMDVKVERQKNEMYRCDICYDEFTQHSELMEHEAFHREIAPPRPPSPLRPLDMPNLLDTNRSNEIPQQDQNRKRISITIPPLKHQIPSINPRLIITNNIETDTSSTTSNVNSLDCYTNSSTDVLLSTRNIGLAPDCINKEVDQNNLDCSVSGNSTFPNNPDTGVTQDCVNSASSNSIINPNSNLAQDKPIKDLFAEYEDLFNPQQDKNTSPTISNDFEDYLVIDEQPPDNTQIATEVPQPSAPRIFVKNIQDLMNPDVLPKTAETPQKQGKSLLRCDECNQSFTKTRTFRRHQRVMKFKYRCSFCDFCTCSSNKRKVHYRIQHKDAYITYCCGKEFLSAADLSTHQLHHNKCPTCNCFFRNLSKHKIHCQRPSITVTEIIQNMQTTRPEEIISSGQSTDVNLVIPPVSSNNTQEGTNSVVANYQLVWQTRM